MLIESLGMVSKPKSKVSLTVTITKSRILVSFSNKKSYCVALIKVSG